MNSPTKFLIVSVFLLLPSAHEAHGEDKPNLRAGFAKLDITPRVPTPMAGYYHGRMSTETHDPLWCRAVVLDDGRERVAIVSLDLITTTRWLTVESRALIESKLSIPATHTLISATHSHTGPEMYDPASTRNLRLSNNDPSPEKYMAELPAKICECVAAAISSLSVVRTQTAIGNESKLAFNRRFFMSDGTVGWNPGKLNPRIVREAGPTDDSLPIVAFYDDQSKLRGLFANYSIHLDTVGGTQWSADMPFALVQGLERTFGTDCHVQYSTGCCGDVNHLDVRHAFPQQGHTEAARIGTRLAAAVLRSLTDLRPVEGERLHASSATIPLPLAEHASDRVSWARSIADRATENPQPPFRDMVEAFRVLDVESREGIPWEAEVQVISLGRQVAWVSLPGEIFVQLGLQIKDGSPFSTTSIHELANGSIGYIPTRQAYPQGNYEVISARCGQGSGERLVDEALRQLRDHFAIQRDVK